MAEQGYQKKFLKKVPDPRRGDALKCRGSGAFFNSPNNFNET